MSMSSLSNRLRKMSQICLGFHRTCIDIVPFGGFFQKKVVERTVWIDDVPGGEEYEVKKITTTATPISAASDLLLLQ